MSENIRFYWGVFFLILTFNMGSEPPNSSSGKTESPSHALTLQRHPSVASDETRTDEKFALGRRGILVVFTLCVLTLMAALDGTSLSVALPVSAFLESFTIS